MSDELIGTDRYGHVTQEQYDLYREHNVSTADHEDLLDVYGHGEINRPQILDAVREFSRDGMYEGYDMIRAAQRAGRI